MTELLILMSFVPFAILALFPFKRTYPLIVWSSVFFAGLCLGLFIFVKRDEPIQWLPTASFLVLVLLNAIYSKSLRVLPLLGCLFLGQALMTHETVIILLLLAFSDSLFCADLFFSAKGEKKSKAVQGLFQAALSLVPAAVGVLLHLHGTAFLIMVALTIIFRLFSWPLNHWVYDIHKETRIFLFYAGAVSAFALWHAQDLTSSSFWPLIWFVVALIFSAGAKYSEVYAALCLGVFSTSPTLGVLAISFWPLFATQGIGVFLVGILSLGAGAVIADQAAKNLSVEGGYALAVLGGIVIARVFAGTFWLRLQWYYEAANIVLALVFAGVFVFFYPLPVVKFELPAALYAGAFILTWLAGLFLKRRKPALLAPVKNVPAAFFSRDLISLAFLEDKPGKPAQIKERARVLNFFKALETEAYVIVLLGVLGVALLWGAR